MTPSDRRYNRWVHTVPYGFVAATKAASHELDVIAVGGRPRVSEGKKVREVERTSVSSDRRKVRDENKTQTNVRGRCHREKPNGPYYDDAYADINNNARSTLVRDASREGSFGKSVPSALQLSPKSRQSISRVFHFFFFFRTEKRRRRLRLSVGQLCSARTDQSVRRMLLHEYSCHKYIYLYTVGSR